MFKKFNKENVIKSVKQNRNKIIAVAAAVLCLAAVFWWGGNMPGSHGFNPSETPTPTFADDVVQDSDDNADTAEDDVEPIATENADEVATADDTVANDDTADTDKADETVNPRSTATPKGESPTANKTDTAVASSTETAVSDDNKSLTCTISVSCATVLNNLSYLKEEKRGIIPSDGIILSRRTVTFNEGESVFNVLQREMKRAKIHLEFTSTPVYDSIYIEGINNLYEFDCGDGSGWLYSVNGIFPGYGCNQYKLKNGDEIKWLYSCDLGKDVGGNVRQGR